MHVPARPLEMRCPCVNGARRFTCRETLAWRVARPVCRSRHALACWAGMASAMGAACWRRRAWVGFAGLGGSAQDGRSGVPVLGQGADAGRRVGARSAGEGSFPEIAKRPVPSGAIFCWVTVRVRRDRSGRARRRRMEWDTQGCFTPRAMWLIGSGFRRARLRAAGSRARDRCFTDSAARCVTSGPMLISGWRRSGESQRPTRARHFGWPCDGSAANRLGGRPANRTRRTIRWVQVNGFRWDRIRRIGHCPLDDKKWGTMSTIQFAFGLLPWENDAASRSVECIRINNVKTISYSSLPTVGRRVVQYAG